MKRLQEITLRKAPAAPQATQLIAERLSPGLGPVRGLHRFLNKAFHWKRFAALESGDL
jgi:hypothetical protein